MSAVRMSGCILITALLLMTAGCGRQVLGVAKPPALEQWEPPQPAAESFVTVVKTTDERTYVGFSRGEIFFRVNDGVAPWMRMVSDEPGCNRPTPPHAVTAFTLVAGGHLLVGYAGAPWAVQLWLTDQTKPCWAELTGTIGDIWSLSVSPFFAHEVAIVHEHGASSTLGPGGDWYPIAESIFTIKPPEARVQVFAEGKSTDGRRRAWAGDADGGLYFSDDVEKAETPAAVVWHRVAQPTFPKRGVVAISVRPERPAEVWVTFAGLFDDSIWLSTDNGSSWHRATGGELPVRTPQEGGHTTRPRESFTAVSTVPGTAFAYVTALVPDEQGVSHAAAFWTVGNSGTWWRQ